MNEFNKITTGYVIQRYKTLPNGALVCIGQEFIAGDQVDYETTGGEPIEIDTMKEVYYPFHMVQPKDTNEISIKWHIEDVKAQAKERHINITDEQAREILQAMKKNHDCNIGINWEVIDCRLDMLGK